MPCVQRAWGAKRASQHIPEFAKRLVAQYDRDGALSQRWVHWQHSEYLMKGLTGNRMDKFLGKGQLACIGTTRVWLARIGTIALC